MIKEKGYIMLTKKVMRRFGEEVDTECMLQVQSRKSQGLAILVVIGNHLDEVGEDTLSVSKRLLRAWRERRRRERKKGTYLRQPLLLTGIPCRDHRYEYPKTFSRYAG